MKLYHYPNCSTCKRAIKYLREHNNAVELINIAEQVPSQQEIEQMLDLYSGDIKKLFNTSGRAYREHNIKDQLSACSREQAIKLLRSDGMLIKRPFLIFADRGQIKGAVGFKEDRWGEMLK